MDTALKEQCAEDSVAPDNTITAIRTLADLPSPKTVPLLGNIPQIKSTQFHHALENWAREFGSLYKIQLGRKQILVVADPALIGTLLRDRPDALRRSNRTAKAFDDLGISGVFTDEGDEWRKQRKLVMRALTPEVIRHFFPTLSSMTERLLKRWQTTLAAGGHVDILRDLKAYTLDVTINLAMGQDINTLEHPHNPLQRDIEFIFGRVARRLTSPFAYWRHIKLPIDRATDNSMKRIRKAITGFIAQARKNINDNPELRQKPSNMMEALIVTRDEPGSEFTDENVIGNAITLVFAGEDTTSNTIAWLLDFVARNTDIAASMSEEADAILGENTVLQAFGALDRFTFTEAATTEAMRLKPVAPMLSLETNCELMIGDILVPRGAVILTCLRHAGMQEENFPQHQEFRPERWLENQAARTNADPARKLFPFGGGARFCPGRFLAMAEIKMVTAMITRNFTMSIEKDAPPVKELFTFTMTPSALPIRLKQRDRA